MNSFPHPCRAAVVGASGGIGAALTAALADAGFIVHALARTQVSACERIRPGRIDITEEVSIAAAFAAIAFPNPPLRLVLVASGLLHDDALQPEKSLRSLDGAQLARSFAVNTIGPALVFKHALALLPRTGRSAMVALSARVGSIGDNKLGGWYGYRASKAALNQIVRTTAIEVKRTHPEMVVAALHPGTVATGLSAPFRANSAPGTITPAVAVEHLLNVVDRLTPSDSGGLFAWDGAAIPF